MSVAIAVAAVVLGAVGGGVTPRLAYRLAIEAGTVSRSACHCARAPRTGPSRWLGPATRCPVCTARQGPPTWSTIVAGAASFGLLVAGLRDDPALPAFLAVAAIGLPLAAIDLTSLRLPDPLVAAAGLAAVLGLVGATLTIGTPQPLLRALAGALVSIGAYVLLALLPGSRLGFGDVKLGGVLGLLLGWLGWPAVLLGLVLPHVIAGVIALCLLLTGRVGRQAALPLGPALLVGALLAALLCG
ncbi:A24 family peptidase [Micromonospora polyrhachis]|uniref:Leader peptidase (Prepilin peptidase)/N-methyltransferase n=1 Tax=Micromonospora polyrhachis TaxID=1282883 RepID=A0A7W7WPT8_9ACTN|nr:prepilin peptidase [Micromonospora polyrhachis]MBB4959074.1 leader peptidase (prepilin peptidase)/N-methyltransferase [Micromonospora polyrhachis]